MGEEPGRRGFALPRLQRRDGPLVGTLLLGFLWATWHLPFYLPDLPQAGVVGSVLSFAVFVPFAMALAFIFTWLFNNTRGSLLLAILLHSSVDGTAAYLGALVARGLLSAPAAAAIGLGLQLGCIGFALLLLGLTRGRLGYGRYQREAEALDLAPAGQEPPAPPTAACPCPCAALPGSLGLRSDRFRLLRQHASDRGDGRGGASAATIPGL